MCKACLKFPKKGILVLLASAVDVKAYVDHDCPTQIIPNSPLTCSSTKKERRYIWSFPRVSVSIFDVINMELQTKNKKYVLISWEDKESERDGSKPSIMGKIDSYAFEDDSLEVIQDYPLFVKSRI